MQLNDKQKEGLARWMDNLSAAALVAFVAGTFRDQVLPHWQLGLLLYCSGLLLFFAVGLRRDML
jgi:hypothetical protein